MTKNSANHSRVFANVVTVDAWHQPSNGAVGKVDLHADVVFLGLARIGGEPESEVRFRLGMKQAEVVIVIPETEPAIVDKASVSRDAPPTPVGERTTTSERTQKNSISGNASASLDVSSASAGVASKLSAEADLSSRDTVTITGPVKLHVVTQSQTEDGDYRWAIASTSKDPLEGEPLEGRFWDPAKPRLRFIDRRTDRSKGIPPSIRIEVRCRREDLVIKDIELKDATMWTRAKERVGFNNREAAAEAYIAMVLADEGLQFQSMEDKFGQLTMASIIAVESPERA